MTDDLRELIHKYNAEHRRARTERTILAGGKHTKADVAKIRAAQEDRCVYCGIHLNGKGHVDHIIPLSRKGSNGPENLQLLCSPCNLCKGTRVLGELYEPIGATKSDCANVYYQGRHRSVGWLKIYKTGSKEYARIRRKWKVRPSLWSHQEPR